MSQVMSAVTAEDSDVPKGLGQRNKWYGRITMSQFQNTKREDPMPSFDAVNKGTPNQKTECCAILLKEYGVGHPLEARAIKVCLDILRYQRQHGHMKVAQANEWMTNSHRPIWNRGMMSMLTTVEDRATHPQYAELRAEVHEWWAQDRWIMSLCECPSGPLQEDVVALGARMGQPLGQSQVGDVCYGLMEGRAASHVAGGKFWRNAMVFQDTFPCILARDLQARGTYSLFGKSPALCSGNYTVTRYERGHVTRGDGLQGGDPSIVAVRWADGERVTDESITESLGKKVAEVTVPRAA